MRESDLTTKSTKVTKGSDNLNSDLRALRVLRGENFISYRVGLCRTGPFVANLYDSAIILGDHISQAMLFGVGNRKRPAANSELGGQLRGLVV